MRIRVPFSVNPRRAHDSGGAARRPVQRPRPVPGPERGRDVRVQPGE